MAHDFKKFEADVEEDAVRHDEKVILDKREDEKKHEVEMDHDKSKLMRDIREKEIEHDEKVIDRKEKDAAKHEAAAKHDEQVITGKD